MSSRLASHCSVRSCFKTNRNTTRALESECLDSNLKHLTFLDLNFPIYKTEITASGWGCSLVGEHVWDPSSSFNVYKKILKASKQTNKQNRNTTPALYSHGEEKRWVVPKWLPGAGIPLPSSKCYQELFGRFPWWKVTRCHMFLFPMWPHSLHLLFLFFLTILFLRDKNLEKTISVGVRAAEPTLRSSGSVKFRAYFLGWCHCSSAKERGASLTGLEMKETKNIQPSYVWETMPALNNLKCRLRSPQGMWQAGSGYQSHRCPFFLRFIFWLAVNKRNF